MIVQRGFPRPPNFTDDRLLKAKAQLFYDTITNGKGAMYSYADRVALGRSLGRRRLHPRAAAVTAAGRRRSLVGREDQDRQGYPMTRVSPLALAGTVWIAALVAVIAVAVVGGWSVTAHGYFAGWLVAVSLPLGALPVLMVRDLVGAAETPTATALRVLLASLPVLALLILPVLFDLSAVFPWPAGSHLAPSSAEPLKGFAKQWYTPGVFGIRSVVYLVLWVLLALFFVRPAPPSSRHRGIAAAGLALHFVIGTLAAYDWWMSLDMAFVSSAYGLLVIAAQASFALAVASLVVLLTEGAMPERPMVTALLAVLFLAAFIQFSQYLVIWSANLPKEIVWYQARWVGALGPIFVIGVPLLLAAASVVLIPAPLAAMRVPALVALGAVLLVAFFDLACLACPRGSFTFAGVGLVVVFLIVVGGLGAICAIMLGGRPARGLLHERARPR